MKRSPLPRILAQPLDSNILEWHFAMLGEEDTPYEGGIYHGRLLFPADFPSRPPQLEMITPSARFEVNVPICTTMTNLHPEKWTPTWTASTILLGFLSYWSDDDTVSLGAVAGTPAERSAAAEASIAFCRRDALFMELFSGLLPPEDGDGGEGDA